MAGFCWLARGITIGYRHPGPVLGGAGLLLVACMLPTLVTLPMHVRAAMAGTPHTPSTYGWMMAISMVVGLLLVPLYAGYLQIIDRAERGQPTRALDVFGPYREVDSVRLIGFGLAVLAVYVVLFGVVIAASGGGLVGWYLDAMNAQAAHLPPPALPGGFWIAMALFAVLGLFMVGFYAVSLGQVALNRRSVSGAIADGFGGALKNVLPLILFAVGGMLGWIVMTIVVMIAIFLIALLGKLAGAWLVFVLAVPIYIALLLTVFTWMFGSMYYLWLDVCGRDGTAASPS